MITKITKTFIRTEKTMDAYFKNLKDVEDGKVKSFMDQLDEISKTGEGVIKEFKHWFIIENAFPYDMFAEINHLLLTKEKKSFSWDNVSQEEKDELELLKKTYFAENYDVVYENLSSSQTQPGWFHLHLLKLKRENF